MKKRLMVPTLGPSDWRRLLADPSRHWRAERSAYELAVAWEAARLSDRGLPLDVARLLDSTSTFRGATLLLGIPEHQVELDGGGHASRTDLWALLSCPAGAISMSVEAKAGEPFDDVVSKWLSKARDRSGKPRRLDQLCEVLAVDKEQVLSCRYQLLHRAAVALIEARRFHARHAVLLVQSFAKDEAAYADFQTFSGVLGVQVAEGTLVRAGSRHEVEFWLGWVSSPNASEADVRAAI